MKYVPSTVVVGPHGHSVTRGYMEIAGTRFYDDRVVVGPNGEHMIDSGTCEPNTPSSDSHRQVNRRR